MPPDVVDWLGDRSPDSRKIRADEWRVPFCPFQHISCESVSGRALADAPQPTVDLDYRLVVGTLASMMLAAMGTVSLALADS